MSFLEAVDYFGVHRDLSDTSSNGHPVHSRPKSAQRSQDAKPAAPTGPRPWAPYDPPGDAWRSAARSFVEKAECRLWSDHRAASSALRYLRGRGFTDDTIRSARLGLHPSNDRPTRWGESSKTMWLPRGIVIPWFDARGISNVNIRRPNGDVDPNGGKWERMKYKQAPGPSAPLYRAVDVQKHLPVVLVEGEFDALAVHQEAGGLCNAVASGSTQGAHRNEWFNLLSAAPAVLVSFDTEAAGNNASEPWMQRLPNAIRWAPHANDAADMLADGQNVHMWIRMGIAGARAML